LPIGAFNGALPQWTMGHSDRRNGSLTQWGNAAIECRSAQCPIANESLDWQWAIIKGHGAS
jgi:hypothetical protein